MKSLSLGRAGAALLGFLLGWPPLLGAQAASPPQLPDAPLPAAQSAGQSSGSGAGQSSGFHPLGPQKVGPRRGDYKTVAPAQVVVPLSAGDKMKLALLEQAEPYALASDVFVAGWQHLRDADPKYGTDSGAFGQRVGAAAIRHASQGIFTDGVFAVAFHQDPRYYRQGTGTTTQRILHAMRRTWETRSDSGTPQINYSLLVGNASAAALTAAYYPSESISAAHVARGYGWSLFGNMLGNQYHEFWPDISQAIFHPTAKAPPPAAANSQGR